MNKFVEGQYVSVSGHGDLKFDVASRDFIDALCVVVKYTRAGLVQVRLYSELAKTFSVRQSNIVTLSTEQIAEKLKDLEEDERL